MARLRDLPADQWQTPSLCRGWTVHHVLAHLTTPFLLDFLVSPMAVAGFLPPTRRTGLRFVAADQQWEDGRGAEVTGPSLSLALGLLGRRAALPDLSGAGVDVLAERLPA